ncbi:MAG TPA: PQQ-binding-like beta-propeller repeat protein [Blastocatellia bacterium]|nr:PQQ-binding-like beta-propeller repeat protein [Blastocatellia bacterium]
MFIRIVLTIALASTVFASALTSANNAPDRWPQFRGPGALGSAEDPKLPDRWSQTENVAWKTEIPGTGWSSPIVWGERIFVTSVVSSDEGEKPKKGLYFGGERPASTAEHRWMVYGIDFKTGKVVWEREVHRGVPPHSRHLKNSYASETPVTDGERVYAYFGNIGLFCFDLNGKPVWQQKWEARKTRFGWGTAASPLVYKDRLYIVNDNDEQSYLAAFDKVTGKQIWRTERETGTNWATPYIWENPQRTELITSGTKVVRSYDLNGKPLWEFNGMSSIAIPTPFSKFGLLYIASGYVGDQHRPVYAIKPGASGNISLRQGETSNQYIAWYLPQGGPYNPSPLVYGDHYYTLYDRGFFTCHDARTGKEVYGKQRIDPAAGAFTSSPWAYNGRIFCLSEDGDTFVIQAGPEYRLLGKNSLDEMCMATPAIARGSLIIRTASKLYRIAGK